MKEKDAEQFTITVIQKNNAVAKTERVAMATKRLVYVLIIVSIFGSASAQVGDRCRIRDLQTPGVCKLVSDCPEVQELAKNGVSPTLCGFHANTIPIVCCENTSNNKFNNSDRDSNPQPNENSFLNVDNSDLFVYPDSLETSTSQTPLSKSEEKCEEYSKLVTSQINAVPLITDPDQVTINVVKCSNNGVPLIVGGKPAAAGEFPFMAALGYVSDGGIGWYCGGTLVSDRYVMTAAHCANTQLYGPPVKVRLGDVDLRREDDGAEYVDYDVRHIKVHEQYKPPAKYNDIALIRLRQRVDFTNFIRPACLWNKRFLEYNKTIATGWGKKGTAEEQSDRLLKVGLNILDNSVCRRSYPQDNRSLPEWIKDSMLCAGELKGGKDTCQGDSGGPLVVTNKKNQCIFYAIGITSFGKGCGGPNLPAIYTKVSEFVPWIENTIW